MVDFKDAGEGQTRIQYHQLHFKAVQEAGGKGSGHQEEQGEK